MTSQKTTEQKLRKIISKFLKEQGQGGGQGGSSAATGGMAVGHGGGIVMDTTGAGRGGQMFHPGEVKAQHFADMFQAVKDVFSTTAQVGKELIQKIFTLIKGTIAGVISVITPLVDANYDKIRKQEEANIKKIRSEYSDVNNRINAAFGDSDVVALAFLAAPGPMMAGSLLKKVPDVARGLASVLTGGYVDSKPKKESIENGLNILVEKNRKNDDEDSKSLARAVKEKKEILSKLESSKIVEDLKKASIETYRSFLIDIFNQAKNDLDKSRTTEDLKQFTGGKFKGIELKGKEKEKFDKLSSEDKIKLEKELVEAARSAIKAAYVKKIQARISEAENANVPDDNPFIIDHKKTIEKINSL